MNREKIRPTLMAARKGHTVIFGPPGVGKSFDARYLAIEYAKALGVGWHQFTVTRQTPAASVIGHWLVSGGDMVWHKGIAQTAIEKGDVLVINDIHLASDDLVDALHWLLDDGEGASQELGDGTILHTEKLQVIATMNGTPDDLDDPVKDRFTKKIRSIIPSEEAMMLLPEDVRKMCDELYKRANGMEPKVSYRTLKHFSEMRDTLKNELLAADAAIGDETLAHSVVEALKLNRTAGAAPATGV